MFAIAAIAGKQYKVTKGDTVTVDRLAGNAGDIVTLDRVLLYSDGKKVAVGKPTVANVTIKAKIIKQEKGEKIDVRRFKSKVRHRRHIGFRPEHSALEIISIVNA
ncbi:50S ribosomal protein L21 [Candidatus Gottesmanbacteria bacterium]|nr:50S ribosomal protein L21 [Candidatus Gottesmanbacteria bacterium]